MNKSLKFGLIVGVVGLVIIIPISVLLGICGPGVSLLGGAVAGFLTGLFGKYINRMDGAKSGIVAGLISGFIMLFGQVLAGILALVFFQTTKMPIFGVRPDYSSPTAMITYYSSGLGTGVCFGVIGILFSALAGFLGGLIGVRQLPNQNITN